MVTKSNVQVTIALTELDLDEEELQAQVQNLLPQLREVDGVEDADLVAVTDVPVGSKALGGFELGTLKALVNPAFIKPVFEFFGRLSNKTFEIEVEAYGEKFKVKASSKEDLTFLAQETQTFLNNAKNRQDSKNG
ncbi:hypothetical protein [Fortiea contorta]|uniref:hypothetical protein n=1 Tax=Fortiea contorta TaxID=1892405 RepID=UPI0003465302|nr:hypothetical protein [Fortiea contorta]